MRFLLMTLIGCALFALPSQARPVSYPGGWTTMLMNSPDMHSVHIHYSPTINYSVGYRGEYDRGGDYWMNSVQVNNLLKRWNMPDAQANFYLKSGLGFAYSDAGKDENETSPAAYSGIAADWENRRFFTSYENRIVKAGSIDSYFEQSARIGVTPYIGDYGDLHTWLMLEAKHDPGSSDSFTLTPLVRFFKDVHLIEAGISDKGDVLFNWVMRY